ncbi:MAG: chorismate mutase [Roseburia sp.]|nr:chorismate mutase [Roseburia sp.]MCM1277925.1 chorismate mutase [Robinsoniella sp.]
MDLGEIRKELDAIDAKIAALYEERMEACKKVAEYKIETGKPILDRAREEAKLKQVASLVSDDFNKQGIEELFQQIMSMSRKLQYQLLSSHGKGEKLPFRPVEDLETKDAVVVFQGAEGAYSQAAMAEYFGSHTKNFHVDTFREAMLAISEGKADYGVLPIENSTAGIVSEIYDLLVEFKNYIVGEQIIQIEHCLLGILGSTIEDIQTVYSHPQSLMQSSRFLNEHKEWQQISMKNNAFAAMKVAEEQDKTKAAIAGAYAGEVNGLTVLKKGVNHCSANSTRFIIVTNKNIFKRSAGKISVCFEIPHESGSLYRMLSHFIYNNLNLTKIESRPIEGRNWEYRFFLDFEGNLLDGGVQNALRGLAAETIDFKLLGNY